MNEKCSQTLPIRKLQNTAAGMPTVSQDTMVNSQEEANRRRAFSTNITYSKHKLNTYLLQLDVALL